MLNVRVLVPTLFASLLLMPAYADILPVTGSAAGTFANASNGSTVGGSGTQWSYDFKNEKKDDTIVVTFAGAPFSGSTPKAFNFGSILLQTTNQPNGTFDADLKLALTFTTPAGQVENFTDGLQLVATAGGGQSGHGSDLVLNFNGFPAPETFTAGSENYTLTYSGFFDSSSNENTPVTSLFVANDGGGTATAYLWGTITAAATTPAVPDPRSAAVPEPASVVLLLTVAGACVFALRRKRQTQA